MSTPRSVLACAVVVLVLGLAGCGGEPPLDRNEFLRKANAECATLKTASEDFQKAQQPTATGGDVAKFLRKAAHRLRRLVRRVDALVPPDDMEENVDKMLGYLADYADGLDKLADDARPDQTYQELLQANGATVDRLNNIASKVSTIVGQIPLVGCVLPG
jgi:hypothetical protein